MTVVFGFLIGFWSIPLVILIGILKEVYDGMSKKGTADIEDFYADVLGVICGWMILRILGVL